MRARCSRRARSVGRCGPSIRRRRGLWPCRVGWRRAAAPTLPWRRPASTGSRSGTSWPSDGFALILANAAHVKNVPGRKTDIDRRGLARGSAGPWPDPRELRPGTGRCRKSHASCAPASSSAVRDRPCPAAPEDAGGRQHQARTQSSPMSIGVSGRAMIEALIAGESDPAALARLAHRRLKASPEKLSEALRGRVTPHHRFLLRLHLQQIDAARHGDRSDRPGGRSRSGLPFAPPRKT